MEIGVPSSFLMARQRLIVFSTLGSELYPGYLLYILSVIIYMVYNFLSAAEAATRLHNLNVNEPVDPSRICMDFEAGQKSLVLKVMKDAENVFSQYAFRIGTVNFILLQRGSYWDFPFTLHDTVVMTSALLDQPQLRILHTITHEIIHLDQRRKPEKYEKYYRTLGFAKVRINFGLLGPFLLKNPDASHYEWIFNGKYVPVALLLQGKIHTVILKMKSGTQPSTMHIRKMLPVSKVSRYATRFGVHRQLYHPNEIVAHIMADYLVYKEEYLQIDYVQVRELLNL